MGVTSGFYNSLDGDRRYDAVQMSSIFDGMISDGVYESYGNKFEIKATTGVTVTVGTGRAWFNHTWTLNDSLLTVVLPEAHASLNRIDEIVIEIDSTESVRANTIKVVSGVAATTPSRPSLTRTATVNQYSLGYIYRVAASTVVLQADITNAVGSLDTPYAASILTGSISPYTMLDDTPEAHKTLYRGANLGSVLTADQKTQIQNGTFKGLWLGDYWVIGGVNYRIVDFDYWYGIGDTGKRFTKHHLVIMPDTHIITARMNSTNTTSGGYVNSQMRTTNLTAAKTIINAAFGTNVLEHSEMLSNSVSSGEVDGFSWQATSTVELPNERMMFGQNCHGQEKRGLSMNQLALFALKPGMAIPPNDDKTWLRDVADSNEFAVIDYRGGTDAHAASTIYGVRPVFPLGV